MKNIGIFGSCQLYYTANFFLNKKLLEDNNLNIKILLAFYVYDKKSPEYKEELNYDIFNNLDILIIENNNLTNEASSEKININITNYDSEYDLINKKEELIPSHWINPFTNKMVKDLNIQFDFVIDDDFYVNRYNENVNKVNNS